MNDLPDLYPKVDLTVFSVANLFNFIMVIVFLARIRGASHLGYVGVLWGAFVLVLAIMITLNARAGREWWTVVLPALFAVFLVLEILLDYILKIEFRNTRLLGPYLLLYYASLFGMIGYTFQMGKTYGFITLVTYFIHQIATFYSYFRVGHG